MTAKEFNINLAEIFDKCFIILNEKSKEYAPNNDRLEHFKEAGKMQGLSSKEALWGMLQKHLTSICTMCRMNSVPEDRWDEKLIDSINYLILLYALVKEDEQ